MERKWRKESDNALISPEHEEEDDEDSEEAKEEEVVEYLTNVMFEHGRGNAHGHAQGWGQSRRHVGDIAHDDGYGPGRGHGFPSESVPVSYPCL